MSSVDVGQQDLLKHFAANLGELAGWRQHLHRMPELAFSETETASFVAERLASWGISVERAVGGTGIVGTLQHGDGGRSVGLRADMDALPITETADLPYRSTHKGVMHACGHDGHMTAVLAAARHLASTGNFDGTVRVIFQPAEEANSIGSGAAAMIDDGLFSRFPVDAVFSMHNVPDMPLGTVSVREGPVLASIDLFDIVLSGTGTHAATPHKGTDLLQIVAHLLQAWQTVASRMTDPLEAVLISASSIAVPDSYNILPSSVSLKGSVRAFSDNVRQQLLEQFRACTSAVAAAFGASAEVRIRPLAPATVNSPAEVAVALRAALDLPGLNVLQGDAANRFMWSDDFAVMLANQPGAYVLLGAGDDEHCLGLHHPLYDFNDRLLPIASAYLVKLVERSLPLATPEQV